VISNPVRKGNLLIYFIYLLKKGANFISVNKISAMKKRSRESILIGSERVNHKINGMGSPEKGCIRKSRVSVVKTSSWFKT
jgi:hypothetical protein